MCELHVPFSLDFPTMLDDFHLLSDEVGESITSSNEQSFPACGEIKGVLVSSLIPEVRVTPA